MLEVGDKVVLKRDNKYRGSPSSNPVGIAGVVYMPMGDEEYCVYWAAGTGNSCYKEGRDLKKVGHYDEDPEVIRQAYMNLKSGRARGEGLSWHEG